jgi:hypothetical protein
MWRNYFGPDAVIFGIDIDESCRQYDGLAGQVRIGSQADSDFLRSVVSEMGGLDVVIDDGSHVAGHQRASFETLFPLLDGNGVYICEDTMTAYQRGYYEGGLGRKNTFIEVSKQVVDDINSDFHRGTPSLPEANRLIDGVHFYQGMIVIEKRPQPRPSHMMIPPET